LGSPVFGLYLLVWMVPPSVPSLPGENSDGRYFLEKRPSNNNQSPFFSSTTAPPQPTVRLVSPLVPHWDRSFFLPDRSSRAAPKTQRVSFQRSPPPGGGGPLFSPWKRPIFPHWCATVFAGYHGGRFHLLACWCKTGDTLRALPRLFFLVRRSRQKDFFLLGRNSFLPFPSPRAERWFAAASPRSVGRHAIFSLRQHYFTIVWTQEDGGRFGGGFPLHSSFREEASVGFSGGCSGHAPFSPSLLFRSLVPFSTLEFSSLRGEGVLRCADTGMSESPVPMAQDGAHRPPLDENCPKPW